MQGARVHCISDWRSFSGAQHLCLKVLTGALALNIISNRVKRELMYTHNYIGMRTAEFGARFTAIKVFTVSSLVSISCLHVVMHIARY